MSQQDDASSGLLSAWHFAYRHPLRYSGKRARISARYPSVRSLPISRRWSARRLRCATCPAREDLNKLDVFRDRSHPRRKAIEDCPVGAVLVMDSRKDARAAPAGAILVTRLIQPAIPAHI